MVAFRKVRQMEEGKVKWFNDEKGYGFVTVEGQPKDIFVHHSNILMEGRRTLTTGQSVSLAIEETDKGLAARDVRLIETPE